jgi:hypothetical protein
LGIGEGDLGIVEVLGLLVDGEFGLLEFEGEFTRGLAEG